MVGKKIFQREKSMERWRSVQSLVVYSICLWKGRSPAKTQYYQITLHAKLDTFLKTCTFKGICLLYVEIFLCNLLTGPLKKWIYVNGRRTMLKARPIDWCVARYPLVFMRHGTVAWYFWSWFFFIKLPPPPGPIGGSLEPFLILEKFHGVINISKWLPGIYDAG